MASRQRQSVYDGIYHHNHHHHHHNHHTSRSLTTLSSFLTAFCFTVRFGASGTSGCKSASADVVRGTSRFTGLPSSPPATSSPS